jgi:hypothetical protein
MDFNGDNECWLSPTCDGHESPSVNLVADVADNAGIMQRKYRDHIASSTQHPKDTRQAESHSKQVEQHFLVGQRTPQNRTHYQVA